MRGKPETIAAMRKALEKAGIKFVAGEACNLICNLLAWARSPLMA